MYRLACWVGGGGWLTWALTDSHHWHSVNGLAALAVGAGILAPVGRYRKPVTAGGAGEPGRALVRAAGPVALEWEARFKRVSNVKVHVLQVTNWDNGAGFDLRCLPPPGAPTRVRIGAFHDALATDARLPNGCGVEVRRVPDGQGTRGEFILAVSTVNRLGVDNVERHVIP